MKKKYYILFVIVVILILSLFISIPVLADNYSNQNLKLRWIGNDVYEFGEYPQSKVSDDFLISMLNTQPGVWNSYNYYIGGEMSDFMKYKDVVYNGDKYRAIFFSSYRPDCIMSASTSDSSYQDDNGYLKGITYWFKYEPLKWRVLNPSTGLVVVENIIDSQDYYPNFSNRTNNGKIIYPNNWEYSSIRTWLNDSFYNTAFTTYQQDAISLTELNNEPFISGATSFYVNNTKDKIFLLSWNDMQGCSSNFDLTTFTTNMRKKIGTDYAKSQGLNVVPVNKYSYWRLRTAGGDNCSVCQVTYNGNPDYYSNIDYTSYGIVPAFYFNLSSEFFQSKNCFLGEHSISKWSPNNDATCLEDGTKTGICDVCGYIETSIDLGSALGHDIVIHEAKENTCTEIGWKAYTTCSRCNFSTYEVIPSSHIYNSVSIDMLHDSYGIKSQVCSRCGYVHKNDIQFEINDDIAAYPESEHNYQAYTNQTWKYTCPYNVKSLSITFNEDTKTEADYDKIYIYNQNNSLVGTYSGTQLSGKTITVTGKSFSIKLTSDGANHYYGFKIDKIVGTIQNHTNESVYDTTTIRRATCTSDGSERRTCLDCGLTELKNISALGHNEVKLSAVAPTCTKTGKTEGKKCSVCGDVLVPQTIISALGHDIEIDMDASPAECTIPGNTESSHCTRCDYKVESVLIPATGHNYSAWKTVNAATCSEAGSQERTCSNCGDKQTKSIAKLAHTYKNVVAKATLTANGKITPTCTVCGAIKKATVIYMPKVFDLSSEKVVYTGKAIKPSVFIDDSKGNLIGANNYTVSYTDNTNVGTATVTIKFKGNYSGTKTLNFTIAPKQVTGFKSSAEKTTSLKLTWTKVTGAKYYKVEQSTDGKTWTVIAKANTTYSLTVSKIKAGTKYQFRVTALDSTKKIAGKVSAVLKTGTLTATPTIKLASTKKATATVTITKVTGATKYTVYKSTDNKKWTKVGDTTKLTYNLTKLSVGKKIYVKVVAVNAYGKDSAYSKVASVTVKK